MRRGGLVFVSAALMWTAACGTSPSGPQIADGAGLRILSPHADALAEVRVELWHQNQVPVEDCRVSVPTAEGGMQLCREMDLRIWNLLGEEIRTEQALPWQGRALGWDQRDNQNQPVDSGIFFTEQTCIDDDLPGIFRFLGAYHVMREFETAVNQAAGVCDWPLYITETTVFGEHKIAPIPVESSTLAVRGEQTVEVTFANPYLVRIRIRNRLVYEGQVNLKHGYYTEIRVPLLDSA